MILTPEQFEEFQKYGTIDGKPVEAKQQRVCPECGTPIGKHNKPHNKRPDKTDMRCTDCVEVPKVAAQLEESKRDVRINKMVKKIVGQKRKARRKAKERARRSARAS